MHSTAVQGYPIVSTDGQNTLLGYIGRAELRYVLGNHPSVLERCRACILTTSSDKARTLHGTTQDTPCSFAVQPGDSDEVEFAGIATGASVDMDEDVPMELVDTSEVLKLWPWVNQVRSRH